METMYILVPISVVLVFLIGLLFWWSLRSGQFDDMEGPAYRMLMDDDHPESEGSATSRRRDAKADSGKRTEIDDESAE